MHFFILRILYVNLINIVLFEMSRILQISSMCFHATGIAIILTIKECHWSFGALVLMGHISCMYHSPNIIPSKTMYIIDKTYNHSLVCISFIRIIWFLTITNLKFFMTEVIYYMASLAYISILYYKFRPLSDLFHASIHVVSSFGFYQYVLIEWKYNIKPCHITDISCSGQLST